MGCEQLKQGGQGPDPARDAAHHALQVQAGRQAGRQAGAPGWQAGRQAGAPGWQAGRRPGQARWPLLTSYGQKAKRRRPPPASWCAMYGLCCLLSRASFHTCGVGE